LRSLSTRSFVVLAVWPSSLLMPSFLPCASFPSTGRLLLWRLCFSVG
jgi:hypothetical protein